MSKFTLITNNHPLKRTFNPPFNRIVVGFHEVELREFNVRPCSQFRNEETGEVPVLVFIVFTVDGEPRAWPSHLNKELNEYVPGQWFKSQEEWEKEEESFRAMADYELQKQGYILTDKKL